VDHTFVLKNAGTSDLLITAIRPACGCTAANLTRQTIPPGESAELSTRLTLAGFDHFNKAHSSQHHYWNPGPFTRPKEHDGDAEATLLDAFHKQNRIQYLS
jgi:hypothetical protein